MSREQWGHGFFTGKEAAHKEWRKEGPFPLGFFFHILDADGKIQKQGIVVGTSGDLYLARYFSWLDGALTEQVYPFRVEDAKDWIWYQTDRDMRMAYAKANNFDQWQIDAQEMLANL